MSAIGKLQELKDAFEKTYLMEDEHIVDVLCANYIMFLLKADPVWTIIVAPPGGAKSEMINTLSTCKYVKPISTITANTIVSGAKLGGGAPASLLHKLSKGTDMEGSGIITFKDMTSLMSEQDAIKKTIMGQLREVFDGHYVKEFGTGQTVAWKGKVTVMAAATFKIHDLRQEYAAMGERFMMYELEQPDRKEAAMRAMQNQESGEIAAYRDTLAEMMRVYLNETITIPEDVPDILPDLQNDLLDLAEMTTRARSDVKRAWYSPEKEIIEVYPPEMPTRFAASLQTLARGLMILNWNETGLMELPEKYRPILHKYALDSITPARRKALKELSKYTVLETKGLALKLELPTTSLRRNMEDIVALGLATRERGSGSKGDRWMIKDEYRAIIHKFEGVVNEGTELTEVNAERMSVPDDEEQKKIREAEELQEQQLSGIF